MASVGFFALCSTAPELGAVLLGQTWATSQVIILPFALFTFANGVMIALVAAHRRRAAFRRSLALRILTTVLGIVSPIVGSILGATAGAAWGLALAAAGSTALWGLSASTLLKDSP